MFRAISCRADCSVYGRMWKKTVLRQLIKLMPKSAEMATALSLEERAALVAELCGWTDDDWDRRMKADTKAGKFAALTEDAANI